MHTAKAGGATPSGVAPFISEFFLFFPFLKEILLATGKTMLYNERVYAAVGGVSDLSREEMIT